VAHTFATACSGMGPGDGWVGHPHARTNVCVCPLLATLHPPSPRLSTPPHSKPCPPPISVRPTHVPVVLATKPKGVVVSVWLAVGTEDKLSVVLTMMPALGCSIRLRLCTSKGGYVCGKPKPQRSLLENNRQCYFTTSVAGWANPMQAARRRCNTQRGV